MNYICSINDYVCTALYLFHSLTFISANTSDSHGRTFKPSRMRTTPRTEKSIIIKRKKIGPSELETHAPPFPVQLLLQKPPFTSKPYARYIKQRQPESRGSNSTARTYHHQFSFRICSRLSYRHCL